MTNKSNITEGILMFDMWKIF